MIRRGGALAFLAAAGVLVAHTLGYAMVHHGGPLGGHGYMASALSMVAPVAVLALVGAAIAEARRARLHLDLTLGRLVSAQLVAFAVQEFAEGLVHGDLASLITEPGVALGLLAQLPVALVLHRLVHLARRAARWLFAPTATRPAPRPTLVARPPAVAGLGRPRWSPLSSRAPPLPV